MIAVLGFAGSAFAIHLDIPSDDSTPAVASGNTSITLSGEIRERYDYRHVSFNNITPDTDFFNQRVRLGVEAKLSPNTKGFIQLESDSGDPGQADPDNVAWGSGASINSTQAATNSYGYSGNRVEFKTATLQAGNQLKGGLAILNAWIQHSGTGLLGVNSGFKVGHQPIVLPNGIFFDHSYYGDDAVIAFVNPIKELEVDAIYLKLRQGGVAALTASTTHAVNLSNSTNGYVLALNYKPNKVSSVAFDVTYVDGQNITETAQVNTGLFPDVNLWNFGLHANTEVSGIRMMVDGELQTGSEDTTGMTTPTNLLGGSGKLHYGGYAVKAGLGYTLQPVKLTLEAAYGSGNDGKSNTKDDTFITFHGPVPTFSYVYDYRTVNAAGASYGGLENTMYIKLDANADVMKDLNVDLAVMQLAAAHAIKNISGTANTNYAFIGGQTGSRNIGTEVDGAITYTIDKGLKVWTEGGYLWAGDFWKHYQPLAERCYSGSVKDAYTIREGIQLNF